MEKIYEHADDLHIKALVAYANNGALWENPNFPVPLKEEEVKDAFKKGMLLIVDGSKNYVTPVKLAANGAVSDAFSHTYTIGTEAVVVEAEAQATELDFGEKVLVSTLQEDDVVVANGKIEGTLKYVEEGVLADYWGPGCFLALKFTLPAEATSVRVGLTHSRGSGLVEIIEDPDKNGAFKISDKDEQKFIVVATDGEVVVEQLYDLSDLVLPEPEEE